MNDNYVLPEWAEEIAGDMEFALQESLRRLQPSVSSEQAAALVLEALSGMIPMLMKWRAAMIQLEHFEKTGTSTT